MQRKKNEKKTRNEKATAKERTKHSTIIKTIIDGKVHSVTKSQNRNQKHHNYLGWIQPFSHATNVQCGVEECI